jgi:hypothetical protein
VFPGFKGFGKRETTYSVAGDQWAYGCHYVPRVCHLVGVIEICHSPKDFEGTGHDRLLTSRQGRDSKLRSTNPPFWISANRYHWQSIHQFENRWWEFAATAEQRYH